jgi:uncharacterized protein YndB with AHSA1/START domain
VEKSLWCRVELAASPERVFRAITDPAEIQKWMPGLVELELHPNGPVALGSTWRETRKMFGREASEVFEVTACDPPRRLSVVVDGTKGTTGKGEFHFDHRLEPAPGGGTVLELWGAIQMPRPGPLTRLFLPLLRSMFRKGCAKDMKALRDYLAGARTAGV